MTAEDPRPPEGQAKLPVMRTQAQFTPNRKSTQTTQPTEEEEQIREQEDRMMEMTSEEQTKGKRMKKIEDSLRDFETILNTTTFELKGSQRKKKKRKARRKFLKKL